jgi:hypothetical protein
LAEVEGKLKEAMMGAGGPQTLSEMEVMALKIGQGVKERMMQEVVPLAHTSRVTADGAEWIWYLAADLIPDSSQIVDGLQACQHLSDAASALVPDSPDAAARG